MNESLVSIIMPAFNTEKYISESIQSVSAQTYQRWELIIVDDGSTDGTAEIARWFAASDSRIRCLFQMNQRQAKARNVGNKQAEGELVAFLDSDDLWMREKLELQVRALQENVADLVFSDGFIFQDNNVVDESSTHSTPVGGFDGAEMVATLMPVNRIPMSSVLMRRRVLEEVGGFDESPRYHGCEDYDLWLTIARRGYRFYGMGEWLVRYRVHSGSTSRQTAAMLRSEVAVVEKHQRHTEEDRQRLRYLRRLAAHATLDQYFLAVRSGQFGRALPIFHEALGLSPLTVCRPRRIGAVIKQAMLAAITRNKERRRNA